ncbi:hypothetical protein ACTFIW_007751 [Dictyostelium discoideum]
MNKQDQQQQQQPQQYQYQQPIQPQPMQLQPQPQQYQSYQIAPPNIVTPLVCQTGKYRLQGTFYSGFSDNFPIELSSSLAPADFSYVLRDINDAINYKNGLRKTLLVGFVLSTILFFFIFIPFVFVYVIILPISILLMAISFFSFLKIQAIITKRVQVVVENFNKIFLNNNISMEITSGRRKHIHIIYPIYFNIQPVMQTFQPIQQQPFQQQQQQQQQQINISKANENENSSLLA